MISLPNLYQTTAFGLTGLVTLDMLSRINAGGPRQIDLIFLDTLYHFDETLELVDKVRGRYPNTKLHIYKPDGCANARDFESIHGDNLWDTNDNLYDYLAKVEPAQRAYAELNVKAVLTGRRKSQGGKRGDLDIIEVDDAGLIKVNPLANWTFKQVREYVTKHNVPYNSLLDMGYKSIGDWHSTRFVSPSLSLEIRLLTFLSVLLRKAKTSGPVDGRAPTRPSAASTTTAPSMPNTCSCKNKKRKKKPLPMPSVKSSHNEPSNRDSNEDADNFFSSLLSIIILSL